ncbi:hypothetical protein F5876DRAFT_70498 [Lentinula aff. lateritia]|uniref:Uncharacterized protein n=1 Tax=Lentinula aff. lateritia TaxID=2804960 RepID=A0ACC1TIJ8_9AGAR|nr:hypothetical protein F5876DRAFT_70498 [Lentinula aff. lateritia]
MEDRDPDTMTEFSEEEEEWEDQNYMMCYRASRTWIAEILGTRVLFPNHVHKLSQLFLVLELYKKDDPKHFWHNIQVSPSTFDELLAQICDHPVFMSQGSAHQIPIQHQLAIAMFRFGHFGNGALVESIAQWAGMSAARMKEEAKEWVEAAWKNGWIFVDGTLIPLVEKPAYHALTIQQHLTNLALVYSGSIFLDPVNGFGPTQHILSKLGV